MILHRLLVSACLMMASIDGVLAQVPGIGTTLQNELTLDGRHVPLPQGNWSVVSTQEVSSDNNNPLSRIYLAELDHGVLSRWIYVATNSEYNRGGWKRNKNICDRTNVHFGYSDSMRDPNDIECWIVNHWGMTMGENASQATVDFYRWSDTRGRPNTAVGVAYFFAKNGDFLTVELMYNPVIDGFPETPGAVWRGSPWHADIASKDPRRMSYLKALKAMGETYFQQLRSVLH